MIENWQSTLYQNLALQFDEFSVGVSFECDWVNFSSQSNFALNLLQNVHNQMYVGMESKLLDNQFDGYNYDFFCSSIVFKSSLTYEIHLNAQSTSKRNGEL